MAFASRIQTVTEITRSIKGLLENSFAFVAVCGEVSNLKLPFSGHLYFTLKDREAQIKAVLFKTQRRYLAKELSDGAQIICRGRISLYEPRGDYQLIADSIEFGGIGDRQAAFEQLKEKLYHEGLFAEAHKKKLPRLPRGIALITSPRGAAVHDFLTVAARRFPSIPIEIHPVSVQGDNSAAEIIEAIKTACRRGHADVIVICRGGGSAEDLWSFNNEDLARAVFQAGIPVVSAIGHEIDFTILDFVADHRAPTPTAAAEIVLPEQRELQRLVRQHSLRQRALLTQKVAHYQHRLALQHRLLGNPTKAIDSLRMRIDYLLARLRRGIDDHVTQRQQRLNRQQAIISQHNPQQVLARHRENLARLRQRAIDLSQRHLERKNAALQQCSALIKAVSPLAVLERGYAIVQKLPAKTVVKSTSEVKRGERLAIRLHEGRLECEVETVEAP